MERHQITLEELKKKMDEYGEYTESALCEVLGNDHYMYIHGTLKFDYCGAFYVYLQGGVAILPVSHIYNDRGFEQIDMEEAHMFTGEDLTEFDHLMEITQKQIEALTFIKEKNRLHFLLS